MSVCDKKRGVYCQYTTEKCNVDRKLPPFLPHEGDAHISKYLISKYLISKYLISYIEEDFAHWMRSSLRKLRSLLYQK